MATVGDGVKIGVGLLLFKLILGVGGCVALLGVTCFVCSPKSCDLPSAPSSSSSSPLAPVSEEKAEVKSSGKAKVQYNSGCNLRVEPDVTSQKVGFAPKGTYPVLEQRGKWRKIEVGGVTGWVGCLQVE